MYDPATYTDKELTEQLQNGSHDAFKAIYNRYWAVLYMHALKMVQDPDAARDAIQDVFTDLWVKSDMLVIHTSLKAYLYTSVRYKMLDMLRQSSRHDQYLASMVKFAAENNYSTDEDVQLRDFIRRMESEVSQLPPRMREIFELSRFEGKSHKAIAQALDITDHAVKKTLNRALRVLRSKLTLFVLLFF